MEIIPYYESKNDKIIVVLVVILFVLSTGACQTAFAENRTITIPNGASNPHFETEAKFWYSPPVLTIHKGDVVKWLNSDTEVHTVTSGKGIDRGSFKPEQSWSFTFDKEGTFYYFCTIHPWMVGAIVVSQDIPDYATDAQ